MITKEFTHRRWGSEMNAGFVPGLMTDAADMLAAYAGGVVGAAIGGVLLKNPKDILVMSQVGALIAPDLIESASLWMWSFVATQASSGSMVPVSGALDPLMDSPIEISPGMIYHEEEDEWFIY